MNREFDPSVVQDALYLYPGREIDLDVEGWLADRRNIALTDGKNIGMFEYNSPGVYTGHYFFYDRGKKAKELAISMLRQMFKDTRIIKGLTPRENRAAQWMTRHLGFTDLGDVDTWVGPCTIFLMTKEDFLKKYGETE